MRRYLLCGLIALIVIGGALLRIVPVWTNPQTYFGGLGVFGDTLAFMSMAENIEKGAGFSIAPDGGVPSILRPPLYPLFLAACLWFRGRSPDFFRSAQGLVDATAILFLFLSARILTRGRREWACGVTAAVLGATCPYLIFYSRQLLSESLGVFFLSLALYLHLKVHENGRPVLWFLAGSALALAGLTRPDAGWVIVPLMFAHWVLLRRAQKKSLKPLVAMALGFILFLVPWTGRNIALYGEVIPFSTGNLGLNLYMGTWEESSEWMAKGWEFPPDKGAPRERREIKAILSRLQKSHLLSGGREMFGPDRRLLTIAIHRIMDDPLHYLKLSLLRLPRLWWIDPYNKYQLPEPGAFPFLVYLAMATLGSVLFFRASQGLILIPWVIIGYVTVVHLPLHVEARFSLQGIPALLLLASGVALMDFSRLLPWRREVGDES